MIAQGWDEEASTPAAVPSWHWLAGDITDAYSANKTDHVSRSYLIWTFTSDDGGDEMLPVGADVDAATASTVHTAVVILDRTYGVVISCFLHCFS